MAMTMVGVVMAVRVRVARAVRVQMFVLVEHNVQMAPKRIGDAAQSLEAGYVLPALEARDHRFRHAKPLRQLLLRFAGTGTQIKQALRTARGNLGAVVAGCSPRPTLDGGWHADDLSNFAKFAQLLSISVAPVWDE